MNELSQESFKRYFKRYKSIFEKTGVENSALEFSIMEYLYTSNKKEISYAKVKNICMKMESLGNNKMGRDYVINNEKYINFRAYLKDSIFFKPVNILENGTYVEGIEIVPNNVSTVVSLLKNNSELINSFIEYLEDNRKKKSRDCFIWIWLYCVENNDFYIMIKNEYTNNNDILDIICYGMLKPLSKRFNYFTISPFKKPIKEVQLRKTIPRKINNFGVFVKKEEQKNKAVAGEIKQKESKQKEINKKKEHEIINIPVVNNTNNQTIDTLLTQLTDKIELAKKENFYDILMEVSQENLVLLQGILTLTQ